MSDTESFRPIPFDPVYRLANAGEILTPALLIYPDIVDSNISATLRLLGGNARRWRPHVKTAKLGAVMRRLVSCGVRALKCATTLELRTACEAGADDVLVAYPVTGANAERVADIARDFPSVRISALIESRPQIQPWRGKPVGLFIDVNSGMDRTGISQERSDEILSLARAIADSGVQFRGLHYYDGHLGGVSNDRRDDAARRGYKRLVEIISDLQASGVAVEEVITSGTPALPAAVNYPGLATGRFIHSVSPGTVVYNDFVTLNQLPPVLGYRAAVLIVSRVISHPKPNRFTCDAGHKAVSADAGVPTCHVLGYPAFRPAAPSEEHLPVDVPAGQPLPAIGEMLYLLPRHVCPTVNNFDDALLLRDNRIECVEPVTARGRETPVARGVRLAEAHAVQQELTRAV